MTTKGTCQTCLFSRQTIQMGCVGLFCHKNPPNLHLQSTPQGGMNMGGLWPPTDSAEWCGAYEPDPILQ